MSFPRCFTTRNRSTSSLVGRWALLLLAWGCGPAARAQQILLDVSTTGAVAIPASNWPWMLWLLFGGIALGVLGARIWGRSAAREASPTPVTNALPVLRPEPASMPKKPAENVMRAPVVQSMRQVQGNPPAPLDSSLEQSGKGKKPKPNFNSRSTYSPDKPLSWPPIPTHSAATTPTPPKVDDHLLETAKTMEWTVPTSTPPAIQELIDAGTTDNSLTVIADVAEPHVTPPKEHTALSETLSVENIATPINSPKENNSIQFGQEGWSIPPTKPYSHEAQSE